MAWNVFKFCTALRGLGSIMILLVLGVVGVTYYAVVLTSYGPALYEGSLTSVTAAAVLILFHGLVSFSISIVITGFAGVFVLVFWVLIDWHLVRLKVGFVVVFGLFFFLSGNNAKCCFFFF